MLEIGQSRKSPCFSSCKRLFFACLGRFNMNGMHNSPSIELISRRALETKVPWKLRASVCDAVGGAVPLG